MKDALALEVFPHKQLSQKTGLCSRLESPVTSREPFRPVVAGIGVLQRPSPLTANCEPHIRRAKSEDSTFLTAREHSSLSSVTSEASGFRSVDSFSAAATSVLPECDFVPRGVSLSWDHAGVGLSSFGSALDSLDGNNNENGIKDSLDSNIESNPVFDSNSDNQLEDTRVATVKVYREIAVQTVPSSGKTRRKSLPRLNLPLGRTPEKSDIESKTAKQTPPSPPSSPLLKVPRLSRPESPHSVDSDTSLSSQVSFKTAHSSSPPPESPTAAAKYIDTSREADISSEGNASRDSSFSQQESFHSCVEADLTVRSRSRKRMDKTIDENCNKNGEQSDGSSKLTFSLPAKTKRAVFDKKRSYSASTFDDDGGLIDLITADLSEEPLTEADKEINAKLLKESQAASERFWNRRGRKNGQVNLGIVKTTSEQPEGSKATSDDGTERTTTPTEQEKTTQQNLKKSEKNQPSEKQVTEKLKEEADDIKAEILKGAGPLPREGPLSKTPKEMEKLRQENKSTHRKHIFMPKMPELVEASEAESAGKAEDSAPEADKQHPSDGEQEAKNEKSDAPPPLQRKKSSILSDALLKSLGLSRHNRKDPLKMSEKEVEMKFTDLSMAIKSSKDTVDKRVEVQTRERDLAEENMSKELDGLLTSVQKLELHIPESALYQHAAQLQQHVAMLQTMTLNLSSKAEGLGQVLQERRISTACEVMVKYVDNLRQMLDRKKAELEEAKKVIQENRLFFRPSSAVADDSSTRTRRISANPLMGKFNQSTRLGATLSSAAWKKLVQDEARRRASVAVFSNQSQQQDPRGRFSSLASSVSRAPFGTFPRSMERSNTVQVSEPKMPFSGTAEEKAKATVTFADEPTSMQRSTGPLGQVSGSHNTSPLSRTSSLKMMPEKKPSIDGKDPSSDESFRQGFEQGVHNQVSQELEDLREQQRIMVENLEELMDSMEDDEKEEISKSTRSYPNLSQVLVHPSAIQWVKVQKLARLAATFFLVLAACCSIVFTLMPAGSLKAGVLAFESPWSTFRRFFWPYTSLLHSDSPPR